MKAQVVRGNVAGIPYGNTVVNIDSADVTALLGAATGLVKVVAGAAIVGAGIAAGIGFVGALLSAIQPALNTSNKLAKPAGPDPELPLGSAPCWIETESSKFWGIILNQDLALSTDGGPLLIPFWKIYKIKNEITGFWGGHEERISVKLVDGSSHEGIYDKNTGAGGGAWPDMFSIRVAALGGVQEIPLKTEKTAKFLWWQWPAEKHLLPVKFSPPRMTDVTTLRDNLKYVLKHQGRHVTHIIGPNVLQTFFNVPGIP
jgi:hypothetical protein